MKIFRKVVKWGFVFLVFAAACSCNPALAEEKEKVRHAFEDGYFIDLGYGSLSRDKTWELGGAQFTTWSQGSIISAKVGYRWRSGLRVELERSRIRNNAAINQPAGFPPGDADGYAQINPTMLNVNYDWGYGKRRLAPYFGFGFGKYTVNLRGLSSDAIRTIGINGWAGPKTQNLSLSDDTSSENAHQFMAGVNYRVNRKFEVHLGYRILKCQNFDLYFPIINTNITPPGPNYKGFEFGVRYLF